MFIEIDLRVEYLLNLSLLMSNNITLTEFDRYFYYDWHHMVEYSPQLLNLLSDYFIIKPKKESLKYEVLGAFIKGENLIVVLI